KARFLGINKKRFQIAWVTLWGEAFLIFGIIARNYEKDFILFEWGFACVYYCGGYWYYRSF
ncbi:hypothetical protein RGC54_09160, partial [Helicobacter pylori]|uniref:hypothetical protein n=1 Tax=Helicobacter pylori TaxID=210 RepID=UPI00292A2076